MMKARAGTRVWTYERKLEEGQGGNWTRECSEEDKRYGKKGTGTWGMGGGKEEVFCGERVDSGRGAVGEGKGELWS